MNSIKTAPEKSVEESKVPNNPLSSVKPLSVLKPTVVVPPPGPADSSQSRSSALPPQSPAPTASRPEKKQVYLRRSITVQNKHWDILV